MAIKMILFDITRVVNLYKKKKNLLNYLSL